MYTKLDNIIRSAIADKGYRTLHKYVPYLHWGIEGFNKWREDGSCIDLKVTKVPMTTRRTVDFPADMIGWNKIGVVSGSRILVFTADNSLSLNEADHGPSDSETAQGLIEWDDLYDFTFYTNIYTANEGSVSIVGHGDTHYFKPNYINKEFQFSSSLSKQEVYIEYVSSGFDPSTETLVPVQVKKLIKEYIFYRQSRFKHGANAGETRAALQDWLEELDDVRGAFSDLSYAGIIDAIDKKQTRITIDQ